MKANKIYEWFHRKFNLRWSKNDFHWELSEIDGLTSREMGKMGLTDFSMDHIFKLSFQVCENRWNFSHFFENSHFFHCLWFWKCAWLCDTVLFGWHAQILCNFLKPKTLCANLIQIFGETSSKCCTYVIGRKPHVRRATLSSTSNS